MRKQRTWQHNVPVETLVYTPKFRKECEDGMGAEVAPYLSVNEFAQLKKYNNIQSQLLKNQRLEIARLFSSGHLSDYKQVWLHQIIGSLYNLQGMTEHTKNFPFPRQYASTGLWIMYIFCTLIPFGLPDIF